MFVMTLRLLERYVNHGPAFGAEETEEELVGLKIGSLILNVEFNSHPDHDPAYVRRTQNTAAMTAEARASVLRTLVSHLHPSESLSWLRERVGEFGIEERKWEDEEDLATACCGDANSKV